MANVGKKPETAEQLDGKVVERLALEELAAVASKWQGRLPEGAVRDETHRLSELSEPADEKTLALKNFLQGAEWVSEVFDAPTPWGSSAREFARELRAYLGIEERRRPKEILGGE